MQFCGLDLHLHLISLYEANHLYFACWSRQSMHSDLSHRSQSGTYTFPLAFELSNACEAFDPFVNSVRFLICMCVCAKRRPVLCHSALIVQPFSLSYTDTFQGKVLSSFYITRTQLHQLTLMLALNALLAHTCAGSCTVTSNLATSCC